MKYDKYILWVLGFVVCLQVWFVTQIHTIQINNGIRGAEVTRMREDVKNMKSQFDEIIFDLAFKRAQSMIEDDKPTKRR